MNENFIPEDFIIGDKDFIISQLKHVIKSLRDGKDVQDMYVHRLELDVELLKIEMEFYKQEYKNMRQLLNY